jgi:hypothetical protein
MRPTPLLCAILALAAARAQAQEPDTLSYVPVFAGGELESYLRAIQLAGVTKSGQWSLRKFSPREGDALLPADSAAHPWSARAFAHRTGRVVWLPATIGTRINSGFPWGINDGAVWAGRGATLWTTAGAAARWGPVSAVLAPIAFVTQNAAFPVVDNGRAGRARFGDGYFHGIVDYPQRFGDRAYGRVDLGESTVRVDAFGLATGVSTAHEWWGPTQYFPALLGTNAPGFAHAFVGSSAPVNLWLARVHGRLMWGRLDQSDYFVPEGQNAYLTRPRRFVTGLATVLQPRGFERLELGLARFVHAPWPDSGLARRYWTRAFEGIFKTSMPILDNGIPSDNRSQDGENQLASVYARLAVPEGGFEVYLEFAREDHPWDRRALTLTPDEQSMLSVGMSKVWLSRDGSRLARLRLERINFQQAQIDEFRGGAPIYLHPSGSNQGHTQRGQLLGAGVGVSSAAGGVASVDVFRPDGRWSVEWMRTVRLDRPSSSADSVAEARAVDAVHSVTVERLVVRGRRALLFGGGFAYDFNRDFAGDRANLIAHVSLTGLR